MQNTQLFVRGVFARATQVSPSPVAAVARCIHSLKDKEIAEEKRYFNVEEERLLRKMAAKAREQGAATEAGKKAVSAERIALDQIVKERLTDAEKELLVKWRHSSEF